MAAVGVVPSASHVIELPDAGPIPNYRLPDRQGPQDTQGRDKSYGVPMNPYERPPITDWKEKTTP